jgi:hypothetical protein
MLHREHNERNPQRHKGTKQSHDQKPGPIE